MQFDRIDELHRGVIVRIQRGYTGSIQEILDSGRLVVDDVLFVVDAGWSTDILSQEIWSSSMVRQISDWEPSAEIACISSSFPNSFSHIEYKGSFFIDDRELFSRLVRHHNSAHLIYGDWGSTRQPEEAGGGTHYDRIDIAVAGGMDFVSSNRKREWLSGSSSESFLGRAMVGDSRLLGPALDPMHRLRYPR
jgi:hypothetical protein